MPPAATKSKYCKNLEVLHFNPAPPQGPCDVSEVWRTQRWTYSPSFVTVSSGKKKICEFTVTRPTLIFGPDSKGFYCTFKRQIFQISHFCFQDVALVLYNRKKSETDYVNNRNPILVINQINRFPYLFWNIFEIKDIRLYKMFIFYNSK